MNPISSSLDSICGHSVNPDKLSPQNVIENEIQASAENKETELADAVWKGVLARLERERVKNSELRDTQFLLHSTP
jgi:hypothetical protein